MIFTYALALLMAYGFLGAALLIVDALARGVRRWSQ